MMSLEERIEKVTDTREKIRDLDEANLHTINIAVEVLLSAQKMRESKEREKEVLMSGIPET